MHYNSILYVVCSKDNHMWAETILIFKVSTPTELEPSLYYTSVDISPKATILIGCGIRIIETLICLQSSHWLKLVTS